MESLSFIGYSALIVAMLLITSAFFNERFKKYVSNRLLWLLFLGLTLNIASLVILILGGTLTLTDIEAIICYAAIADILIVTYAMYDYRKKRGLNRVPKKLHRGMRIAYTLWLIAFFTGSFLHLL